MEGAEDALTFSRVARLGLLLAIYLLLAGPIIHAGRVSARVQLAPVDAGACTHVTRTVGGKKRRIKVCKAPLIPTASPTPTIPPPWEHQGNVQVAVIITAIPGSAPPPSREQVEEALTGEGDPERHQESVEAFYRSYGVDLTFTVVGPLAMEMSAMPARACTASGDSVSPATWRPEYEYAASLDSELRQYRQIMVVTRDERCGSYIGYGGADGDRGYAFVNVDPAFNRPLPSMLAHELGHALGLNHQSSVVSDSGTDPFVYTAGSSYGVQEHGQLSLMGSNSALGLDTQSQIELGYLKPEGVRHVTQSGVYGILRRSPGGPGVRALTISKGKSGLFADEDADAKEEYLVEYITPTGEDAADGYQAVNIMVRNTHLQLSHPLADHHYSWVQLDDRQSTYRDTVNRITITLIDEGTDAASLRVELG